MDAQHRIDMQVKAKRLVKGGVTEGTRTPDLRDHNPTL
jgi:hypothetical protein